MASLFRMRALGKVCALVSLTFAPVAAQPFAALRQRLDQTAQTLRSAKASFSAVTHNTGLPDETDQGTLVVDPKRMRVDFTGDNAHTIVMTEQRADDYHPKLNQIDEWNIRQFRDVAQPLFHLGFGVAGRAIEKDYQVKSVKAEKVGDQNATMVELIPKSAEVLKELTRVELWISDVTNCAVRQKFYSQGGSYRVVEFSHVQTNPKLDAAAFDLPKNAKRQKMN